MRSKAAYKIEKAVSPKGLIAWAVVDELFEMHYEASAFLYWLRDGMSRSENTTETYARRIALFLSWTIRNNIDWRSISLTQLVRYKRWLAETPIGRDEARLTGDRSTYRLRAGVTVNAHITAVSGMIRFAARQRLIESHVAEQLSEQRYMTSIPRGYDVGEDNQWRTYRARLLVATEEEPAIETLTDDEILRLLAECRNRRDRFLIYALRCTGVRIGELLGMRRSDMHLLPSSKHVRCSFAGPHIHVRRREDNDNFALSKSRRSRAIPVDDQYVEMYMDYRAERDRVPAALSSDLVMVNLFREPLGRGMTYDNAESLLQRLSRRSDFYARPHMLRHTFATRLLESGASIDTVRELLGHQSISSTGVYLHADQADMRAAVLKVSLNLGDSA